MTEEAIYETKDTEWYYWQDEAGRLVRSPRVPFDDVVRGQCSGIPECCIKYFVDVWSQNNNPWKDCPEHAERMMDAKEKGLEFFYIPCPACIATENFVETKDCTESNCFCGQWERREVFKEQDLEKNRKRRSRMARKKRRGYL